MRMGVVKKKKENKMFHSWDRTRDYRIGRLVSYPLGHQGSWVFHERLYADDASGELLPKKLHWAVELIEQS